MQSQRSHTFHSLLVAWFLSVGCSGPYEERISRRHATVGPFHSDTTHEGEARSASPEVASALGSEKPVYDGVDEIQGPDPSEASLTPTQKKKGPVPGLFLVHFAEAEDDPSAPQDLGSPNVSTGDWEAQKNGFLQSVAHLRSSSDPSDPAIQVVYRLKQLPILVIAVSDPEIAPLIAETKGFRLRPVGYVKSSGTATAFHTVGLHAAGVKAILQKRSGESQSERDRPTIAVVDSGIDPTKGQGIFGMNCKPEETLQDSKCRIKTWKSFVMGEDQPLPLDPQLEHGSVVGGIIASATPEAVNLVSLRTFRRNDSGTEESSEADILAAIDWAIGSKKKYLIPSSPHDPYYSPGTNTVALNMSLSNWDGSLFQGFCSDDGRVYEDAFRLAREVGILPVVAAGNEGARYEGLPVPACVKGAFSVGAFEPIDSICHTADCSEERNAAKKASFSSVSDCLGIFAPGTEAYLPGLTLPDGTPKVFEGTSMAAPYVASAAALVALEKPGLSADDIKKHILERSGTISVQRTKDAVPSGETACGSDGKRTRSTFAKLNFRRLLDTAPPDLSQVTIDWVFSAARPYLVLSGIKDDASGLAKVQVSSLGKPLVTERLPLLSHLSGLNFEDSEGRYKVLCSCFDANSTHIPLQITSEDFTGKVSQRTLTTSAPQLPPLKMSGSVEFQSSYVAWFSLRWKAPSYQGPLRYKASYLKFLKGAPISYPDKQCTSGMTLDTSGVQINGNWVSIELKLDKGGLFPSGTRTTIAARVCAIDQWGRVSEGITGKQTYLNGPDVMTDNF